MQFIKPIHYVYYSNLSVDALKKSLSDELIPTNMIPPKKYYGIEFDGKYHPDGSFVIKKTDWNVNGRRCKPHVFGKIVNENGETRIDIEIKPLFGCILPIYILIFVFFSASFVALILQEIPSFEAFMFMTFMIILLIFFIKRRFKRRAKNLIIPLVALLDAKSYYPQD